MRAIRNAVAAVGKYQDRQGQEKTRYLRVGKLFKREDDTLCLKLDSVPVGPDFEGWINFYEIEERAAPKAAVSDDVPF